ncbi:MAG TPA: LLM class flavin-dependent oxidoreductase [Thermomicrobiales bacterium]|nr:LLM class flavin-dependent oxidoreductase [Thermomicrobiales bacterium]
MNVSEGHRLRVGVVSGSRLPYSRLSERWQELEELGFDTAWVTDHFITGNEPDNDNEPIYEAWTLIAGLATATKRIRFGIMVCGNTYRNPALLAKQAVTVDHISNGRLELGIGAGWWVREHEAYGYPMPGARELVDRFAEALEIISALQAQPRTEFRGDYYWVADAPFEPKAIQQPHIPLIVGASGPRMLGVTAKHADIWNTRAPVEESKQRSQLLDRRCRDIGRDPGEIMRSTWPYQHPWDSLENVQDVIQSFRDVGFTDFVFAWPPDEKHNVMVEFAREILPALRTD